MSVIDFLVLFGTLILIVVYGTWKTRGQNSTDSYLRGGGNMKWWTIGLSIMATQASAITFLSTPGQAYESGMGFVQFYFGLPIAMVIIAVVFVPIYFRLKVYTAYEFLEARFDLHTRQLTAFLFLLCRGLSAGLTIYAPAIILTALLGWNLNMTCLLIGGLVIVYTVAGGTRAVSVTQKQQMAVMMGGMVVAFILLILYLPKGVSFLDALDVAGSIGHMEIIDFKPDPSSKYNIWSGLIGGTFLALSYFGTDQSQVQRYLGGKSMKEIRTGLMFNGLLKIPMQFFILLIGVMTFVFYQFNQPPVHFDQAAVEHVKSSGVAGEFVELEHQWKDQWQAGKEAALDMISANHSGDKVEAETARDLFVSTYEGRIATKEKINELIAKKYSAGNAEQDFVFLTFVLDYLPVGLVGLLLAVMFSAAMSSTSAELNALATTTVVDFYQKNIKPGKDDRFYLRSSRWITFAWGCLAILFAFTLSLFDNLIEAVNIVGSLFYGTILGVFLVAFFIKSVKGTAVFTAALISQIVIGLLYFLNYYNLVHIAYLWYNLLAPAIVIVLSILFQLLIEKRSVE